MYRRQWKSKHETFSGFAAGENLARTRLLLYGVDLAAVLVQLNQCQVVAPAKLTLQITSHPLAGHDKVQSQKEQARLAEQSTRGSRKRHHAWTPAKGGSEVKGARDDEQELDATKGKNMV